MGKIGPRATHGILSTYNRGCRCKPCTRARRDANRVWRAAHTKARR
jgi:hypothetical protein